MPAAFVKSWVYLISERRYTWFAPSAVFTVFIWREWPREADILMPLKSVELDRNVMPVTCCNWVWSLFLLCVCQSIQSTCIHFRSIWSVCVCVCVTVLTSFESVCGCTDFIWKCVWLYWLHLEVWLLTSFGSVCNYWLFLEVCVTFTDFIWKCVWLCWLHLEVCVTTDFIWKVCVTTDFIWKCV